MKFYCNGSSLSDATSIVSKALAINKNIPILEGIKIKALGKTLTLSAYNQELYIEKTINAEILTEGELVVNGKIFNDYINKMSSIERIEISTGLNNKLNISYGKSICEINFYEINNFPNIGDYNEDISIKIKERELKELLERAIFCVSMNDTRILLRSCKIEINGDNVVAVCTDGFRISISKKIPQEKKGNFKTIVLGKIINDIVRILEDNDDIITISKYKNMVIFDLGHTKIKATTVEGDYYNYNSNIPKNIKTELVVNKNDLDQCLVRAGIISRESVYNFIIFSVEQNMIDILAESEKGKINETLDCNSSGEEVKIGINNKFLQEAINKIKEDFVKIEIENNTRPIIVRKVEGDEFLCVILPVRLM